MQNSVALAKPSSPHYLRIAEALIQTLASGALRPGDRLISARKLAQREQVSLPTALEALRCLEAKGLVVARPRSGYFVPQANSGDLSLSSRTHSRSSSRPLPVTMAGLARSLFSSADMQLIPLGAALPDPAWLPASTLQRALQTAGRRLQGHGQTYSMPPGRAELRAQIAARAAQWGGQFGPDDVIVTAGATQAVRLALRAVCKPGDVVAIERPAYFGTLLVLEDLGLKALEIATDPHLGMLPDAVATALAKHKLKAVLASPTVQNPLGACMPVERKRALVALLEQAGVPLIEDDVYGDLAGDTLRPPACTAFDISGNVLYCSSVSKTLAPGWRIGWIAPGRFQEQVLKARLAADWAGVPLLEAALSEVLGSGDYDRHLRRLKPRMQAAVQAIMARVESSFPAGTRVSTPSQGFLLWVQLPPQINAIEVYRHALALGIGVSPGQLFTPQADLPNYLRLNCANDTTPRLLGAVGQIGEICCELMRQAGSTD